MRVSKPPTFYVCAPDYVRYSDCTWKKTVNDSPRDDITLKLKYDTSHGPTLNKGVVGQLTIIDGSILGIYHHLLCKLVIQNAFPKQLTPPPPNNHVSRSSIESELSPTKSPFDIPTSVRLSTKS